MNKPLESVVTELNPVHDFYNIKFYKSANTNSLAEGAKVLTKNLSFFATLVKPLARGGVIGGTIGMIGSSISGNSLCEGFICGSLIGGCLDFQQYMIRGTYHYFRAQL